MIRMIRRRLWASAWKDRSFSWRLSLMAIIPLLLIAVCEVIYLWGTRPKELNQDLRERGEIIAAAVAENGEYGLTSGNMRDLDRVVHSLVQADTWIYQVEVYNAERRLKLLVRGKPGGHADGGVVYANVFRRTLPVDDFGGEDTPHLSGAAGRGAETTEVIGEVRVFLSRGPAEAKQRRRIVSQSILLVVVGALSAWVAAILGKALHRPMNSAIRALREIRGGDYAVNLPVDDGGEMGELLDTINKMSASLDDAKRDLENKVWKRTRDLEASVEQVRKADAEKRRLIQKVDSAVEDERKSISIEIHDELNAALLGARYSSRRILDMTEVLPAGEAASVIKDSAESIVRVTSELYSSARKIVRRLRPEVLDMLGLQGAIEEMLQTYESAPGAPTFAFRQSGDFQRINGGLAIAAYRLIQECVSNVMKHAHASHVVVVAQIRDAAPGAILRLVVMDDGIGFDPDKVQEGIGLIGMRERVYAFKGTLELSTGTGTGTKIEISLPLENDSEKPDSQSDLSQGGA